MSDAVTAAVGRAGLGVLIAWTRRLFDRATFTWRVARHAVAAAKDEGYSISLKQLRLLTRRRLVRDSIRFQRPADVAQTMALLGEVRATNPEGASLSPERMFDLLRTAHVAGVPQVARDLAIRDEVLNALGGDGRSREALWDSNLKRIPPAHAKDARELRLRLGDAMDRVLQDLAPGETRGEVLTGWLLSRPRWIPADGRLFTWLGEMAFDADVLEAAARWFQAALAEGSPSSEYIRARLTLMDKTSSDEEKVEAVADITDHPLIAALIEGIWQERLERVDAWQPSSAVQAGVRAVIRAEMLVNQLQFDEAIELGQSAFELHGFSGAGINAVEAYLRRSATVPGAHADDATAGLKLALRIRDARREWGVTSGNIASKAIRAATMLSDFELAFALGREPDATPSEATHPDVRAELAMLSAMILPDPSEARQFMDDETPAWLRLQVESREAELVDDIELAKRLLAEAIDATNDPNEKARLVFRLAMRGELHPFVEDIRELNPDKVEEIEITAALYGNEAGAEDWARAKARDRPTVAFALIEYLNNVGRPKDGIFVAEQSAEHWSDPELWLSAARMLHRERDYPKAIDRAAKALITGGSSWGNKGAAYVVQVEAGNSAGDWTTALTAGRALVNLDPRSESARWALARVRRSSGDVDQAYSDWLETSPRPRDADEACLWLDFFRGHGSDMATLEEFFSVATEFAEDPRVRNVALGSIATAPVTEPIGELNLSSLLDRFERDYPGQNAMWRVSVDVNDESINIVEQLAAAMGPHREGLEEVDKGVRSGTFPIGIAATFAGRNIAELLTARHKAPRFAGSLTPQDSEPTVDAALGSDVVVDTSALFTLSLLEGSDSNRLVGKFARLVTASEQMLDAAISRERFGHHEGGTLFPGSASEKPSFRANDPIEEEIQERITARLYEMFRRTDRHVGTPPTLPKLKKLDVERSVWCAAIEIAARRGVPLWCDDAATRAVAQEVGVKSFGTPALVERLRDTGAMTASEADQLDADLVRNWTIGVNFRRSVYDLLALKDPAPQGAAAAILHGGPQMAAQKLVFILSTMGKVIELPDMLGDWVKTAFNYIDAVADNPQSSLENRIRFLHAVILQSWANASNFLFVVRAARESAGAAWDAVFEEALRRAFGQIEEQHDRVIASTFSVSLIANLESRERELALAIILAP